MPWDKRGYFTSSTKVNGRTIRHYWGRGELAFRVAHQLTLDWQEKEAVRLAFHAMREDMEEIDAPLADLDNLADLLGKAALLAAGFHQHKHGEWRRKRHAEPDRA